MYRSTCCDTTVAKGTGGHPLATPSHAYLVADVTGDEHRVSSVHSPRPQRRNAPIIRVKVRVKVTDRENARHAQGRGRNPLWQPQPARHLWLRLAVTVL